MYALIHKGSKCNLLNRKQPNKTQLTYPRRSIRRLPIIKQIHKKQFTHRETNTQLTFPPRNNYAPYLPTKKHETQFTQHETKISDTIYPQRRDMNQNAIYPKRNKETRSKLSMKKQRNNKQFTQHEAIY